MPSTTWLDLLRHGTPPAVPPTIHEALLGGDDPPDGATPLWLGCAWDPASPRPREAGFGLIWHTDCDLCVRGLMVDSDVANTAVGRNDRTWLKGDVLELFFQPAGSERYVEAHVTPSLATLEYAIPEAEGLRAGRYADVNLGCDLGLRATAKRFDVGDLSGWQGTLRIPLANLGVAPESRGPVGSFCVCRYNYNRAWGKTPECSASAPFPTLAFHQPAYWHRLVLA